MAGFFLACAGGGLIFGACAAGAFLLIFWVAAKCEHW